MKINEAKSLIKTNLNLALNKGIYISTLFISGPGLGKSSIVQQATEELSVELGRPVGCKPFFLTTVEPPDVRGFGLPDKDSEGNRIMTFTLPPWAVRKGEPEVGILFLDELGQASHDVQKPAAELLLNRRVGSYSLPPGWIVVAASNRESDRSGVQRELAFITNRRMVIKIEPNLDAWVHWAETKDIHPLAIAFARTKPGIVFADTIPEKPGPFCTPRSLVMLSQLIGELDMGTFTEAACGLIGEGAAGEFVAFLRVAEQLPKFEDIVANPSGCEVPKRADASYAAMQMIAHRVDDKSAKAAFTYLKRMGKEFQVAGLRGTFHRCPQMVRTPDFAAWLRDNKELVMAANLLGNK
jgi:hypothetical protein